MECHGDDLCTLQELSDSTLLSCLEARYTAGVWHVSPASYLASLYLALSIFMLPCL